MENINKILNREQGLIRIMHDEKLIIQHIMHNANLLPAVDDRAQFASVLSVINSGCAQLIKAHEEVCETSQFMYPYRKRTDIVELARSVMLISTASALKKRITLRLNTDLPHLYGYIDPLLIKRMLLNLTTNAIQYAPAGGNVTIKISHAKSRLLISVFNNGKCIDKKLMPRLFEMYASGSSGGTGIGLSTAQLIAQCHGGSIRCQSKPGKGTLVEVHIPLKAQPMSLLCEKPDNYRRNLLNSSPLKGIIRQYKLREGTNHDGF